MSDRYPPGRGSQLTAEQRREIQHLGLVEGLSQAAIARRTGRDRATVSAVLKADDSRALQEALLTEGAEEARRILRGYAIEAAQHWRTAVDVASQKGDHKPARDLLMHSGAIAPLVTQQSHVGIRIVLGTEADPLPDIALEPVDGRFQTARMTTDNDNGGG